VGGKWYWFNANKTVHTESGLQELGGMTYYVHPESSDKKYSIEDREGIRTLDGQTYYIQSDKTVYAQAGFHTFRSTTYYFNPDKTVFTDTGFQKIDGKTYYFNANHTRFEKTGMQMIEGTSYQVHDDFSVNFHKPVEYRVKEIKKMGVYTDWLGPAVESIRLEAVYDATEKKINLRSPIGYRYNSGIFKFTEQIPPFSMGRNNISLIMRGPSEVDYENQTLSSVVEIRGLPDSVRIEGICEIFQDQQGRNEKLVSINLVAQAEVWEFITMKIGKVEYYMHPELSSDDYLIRGNLTCRAGHKSNPNAFVAHFCLQEAKPLGASYGLWYKDSNGQLHALTEEFFPSVDGSQNLTDAYKLPSDHPLEYEFVAGFSQETDLGAVLFKVILEDIHSVPVDEKFPPTPMPDKKPPYIPGHSFSEVSQQFQNLNIEHQNLINGLIQRHILITRQPYAQVSLESDQAIIALNAYGPADMTVEWFYKSDGGAGPWVSCTDYENPSSSSPVKGARTQVLTFLRNTQAWKDNPFRAHLHSEEKGIRLESEEIWLYNS
jgi:hypothetical protein